MQTGGRQLRIIGLTFLVLLAVLVQHSCHGTNNKTLINPRIVGGVPSKISRLPYLVNIRVRGTYVCGGTLVNRRYVVTAAHCVQNVRWNRIRVVGGTASLSRGGTRRRVTKVMVPKKFSRVTLNKDIAVLKLNSDMTGNNIRPIGLCNRNWKKGSRVTIAGWGLTRENSTRVPNRVRRASIRIMSKATCQRRYRGWARLTNSMFCASVPGSRDTCSGDAGGPVIYRGRLCGVVSWGIGCARNRFPGVHTSVKKMRKFILEALTR